MQGHILTLSTGQTRSYEPQPQTHQQWSFHKELFPTIRVRQVIYREKWGIATRIRPFSTVKPTMWWPPHVMLLAAQSMLLLAHVMLLLAQGLLLLARTSWGAPHVMLLAAQSMLLRAHVMLPAAPSLLLRAHASWGPPQSLLPRPHCHLST
jgi:hypothetical protein